MTEIKQIFRETEQFLEREIEVAGWVRNIRASKKFGFIELNDGTFFQNLQIVFEEDLPNFDEVCKLGISTALVVTGKLVASPGSGQAFELKASEILVEGSCPSEYPLQKKRHSFEYLRTIAHLRPRTNTFSAVFRLRSVLAYAIHQYFQEKGFVYVHTPIITASDCEGAGEMFQLTTLDMNHLPLNEAGDVDF
ncbi:MAG: asparagine--tRNA ligase, partial [Peptococcaceae bacterium]|nr:asparagine--tRNA ligase [Peptococcaceae bacterium]